MLLGPWIENNNVRNSGDLRGITGSAKSLKKEREGVLLLLKAPSVSPFTEVPTMCDFHPRLYTRSRLRAQYRGADGKPTAA
jgi:hypothetical protein